MVVGGNMKVGRRGVLGGGGEIGDGDDNEEFRTGQGKQIINPAEMASQIRPCPITLFWYATELKV